MGDRISGTNPLRVTRLALRCAMSVGPSLLGLSLPYHHNSSVVQALIILYCFESITSSR
ncbi:hypothetical protein PISMIDRAFT_675489 [Pisolithus microcarpus 441]|uniref:Uncharacterized protein n=1 Tax=Pisolithus microcarpus 441 TaxID=765257 RepID=A0A0C9YP84_9AGAM|nr:hypothetical protein PISMIDRAFT_675489 [Pisolithus microcarpus 441]